jgi:hypothetical protein
VLLATVIVATTRFPEETVTPEKEIPGLSALSWIDESNAVDTPSRAIRIEVPCSVEPGETPRACGGGTTSKFADP